MQPHPDAQSAHGQLIVCIEGEALCEGERSAAQEHAAASLQPLQRCLGNRQQCIPLLNCTMAPILLMPSLWPG